MKQTKQLLLPMGGLILNIKSIKDLFILMFFILISSHSFAQPALQLYDDSTYFEASIPFDVYPLADGYAYKLFSCIGFDNLWDMVIIDNEPNSIEDFSINSSLVLFPTVIDDYFDVKIDDSNIIIKKVVLYSADGKIVNPQISNNRININESFSSGYYTVFIYTNKGVATKRIIKK